MAIQYHYFPTSHWSRVASLVVAEKGLEVERIMVDIRHNATFEPSYIRLNCKGVVPTLVHDGEVVTNTLRITAHLDAACDGASLYTGMNDDEVIRRVKQLEGFPTMLFSYSVWIKGRKGENSASILDDKVARAQRYATEHPELQAHYARKAAFFEAFRMSVHDADHVASEVERCRAVLDEMGRVLRERAWLAGERYSLADCIATALLYRLIDLELLDHWNGDEQHGLHDYYQRLCARPSFRAVFRDDPLIALHLS